MQRRQSRDGSIGQTRDHGVEVVIILPCCPVQIGLAFALSKAGSNSTVLHVFRANVRPRRAKPHHLDDLLHHVRTSQCARRLVHSGVDVDGRDASMVQRTSVTVIILSDRTFAVMGGLHVDTGSSRVPFPGSVRLTYGRPSSPETRPPSYFPRRLSGFLAVACASKYLCERVLPCVAVLRIQAVGGGHFRSRIAGKWFPDETPHGDFQ